VGKWCSVGAAPPCCTPLQGGGATTVHATEVAPLCRRVLRLQTRALRRLRRTAVARRRCSAALVVAEYPRVARDLEDGGGDREGAPASVQRKAAPGGRHVQATTIEAADVCGTSAAPLSISSPDLGLDQRKRIV
jgi:hypothetical protein